MNQATHKISDYLTIEDATKARPGFKNQPTPTQLEALKAWGLKILDPICRHFVTPPYLHSVFRDPAYNTAIGGDPHSQHMDGEAGDLDYDDVSKSITNRDLFIWVAKNLIWDQMIWEKGTDKNPGWVHISYVASFRPNRKKLTQCIEVLENGVKKTKYKDFDLADVLAEIRKK